MQNDCVLKERQNNIVAKNKLQEITARLVANMAHNLAPRINIPLRCKYKTDGNRLNKKEIFHLNSFLKRNWKEFFIIFGIQCSFNKIILLE